MSWSPEQIANRRPVGFPDDESMRISHEAICQALYVHSRGALTRELVASLRTGRALRVPRARARKRPGGHVTAEVLIGERPAEAEDRAVPGHWEGDLIIGLYRSAIGTVVERTTRFTMLLHLPRMEGYGIEPRVKNGPALAGYGAVAMRDALTTGFATMPEQLRRSLTWDRGKGPIESQLSPAADKSPRSARTRIVKGHAHVFGIADVDVAGTSVVSAPRPSSAPDHRRVHLLRRGECASEHVSATSDGAPTICERAGWGRLLIGRG
jgi:hypothetical protein